MTRQQAFKKLGDSRDEYLATKFALSQILQEFDRRPTLHLVGHQEQITSSHLRASARNLQITYLVRLFGEFEGILRDYWLLGRGRQTQPRMIDLINSLAAYCTMNADDVQNAHKVRNYRNDVIHNHLQDPRFDFQTCFSRLASFIRWLPRHW